MFILLHLYWEKVLDRIFYESPITFEMFLFCCIYIGLNSWIVAEITSFD